MERQQNPDLLSMAALGATGGQDRADGSRLERGVHLRWQMASRLGFPPFGFDVYRREQDLATSLLCGHLAQADGDVLRWVSVTPGKAPPLARITSSVASSPATGCGTDPGVQLAGQQTITFDFQEPIRYITFTLDAATQPTPQAAAFWRTSSDLVQVAVQLGLADATGVWIIQVFADRIDRLVLSGQDLLVCEVCVVRVMDGYNLGWGALPLNGTLPIYLPITNPEWFSPHAHTPDDQAEAESRLPANLSADQEAQYASGFADDLHGILYDLVGTDPQNLYLLNQTDEASPAEMQWPGVDLLLLLALDPNLARIQGLYWRDLPPTTKFYDYKIVAHYGQSYAPGQGIHFSDLDEGAYLGTSFTTGGLSFFSPNPLSIDRTTWDGSEWNGLAVAGAIPNAPLSVLLPGGQHSAWVRGMAQADLTVSCYAGPNLVMEQTVSAGERDLGFNSEDPLTSLTFSSPGGFSLVEIGLGAEDALLMDLEYVSFHHRLETPPAVFKPILEAPQLEATRTGLQVDGSLQAEQSSVDLRWGLPEAGGDYFTPGAPVFYQVDRADRGNAATPAPVTTRVVLNADSPVLLTAPAGHPEGLSRKTGYFTDRGLADGWYSYRVRGIDLFGRLGPWSAAQIIRVQDHLPPPPPAAVAALYLDPSDPWLAQADRDWTKTNGAGLKVSWEWAGIQRLQAPDVRPPAAEFRIYTTGASQNSLSGSVLGVTAAGSLSSLATDLTWNGAVDALAGEVLRVNQDFFTVAGNSQGPGCVIQVTNLVSPPRAPQPGPCSLAFTPGRSYWTDYNNPAAWDLRLAVTPASDIPLVSGIVQSVVDYVSASQAVTARPGATRTLITDQALLDLDGTLTPGALLCDGVVYPAYGHTLGGVLQVHLLPQPGAAQSLTLVEPTPGAAFAYYPGRAYEVRVRYPSLTLPAGSAAAAAQVAVSCSDGRTYIPDDPLWAKAGRGGLGRRPGNEGALSRVSQVRRINYLPPAAPAHVPPAGPPIVARPANYYGQAQYTFTWEAVPQAAGYAIYRASGAALCDHDRRQRMYRQDYYAPPLSETAVFADDPGFSVWLAGFDPIMTRHILLTNPEAHLDAWRSWAARFYPTLSDAAIQALANRDGNEKALQRVNKDPLVETATLDTFDGRGLGYYLYRVRSVDAAGNLGAFSATYPPVHIYDVTPPATPIIGAVTAGDRSITISWRSNTEADLQLYRIWRADAAEALADVRRLAVYAEVLPEPGEAVMSWLDSPVDSGADYYYRLGAVDTSGNVSAPTAILQARAFDLSHPLPPVWNAAWFDPQSGAVLLSWTHADSTLACLAQRCEVGSEDWNNLGSWLPRGVYASADTARLPDLSYNYRLVVMDGAGRTNLDFAILKV